jgi:hypothetical protein
MLTTTQLRAMGRQLVETRGFGFAHGTKTASADTTVFLSHSHLDKDTLVAGASKFLQDFGVKLYVDWEDESMPESTSHETASKIKSKIRENRKFLLLATPNALASRWVPWELGIADMTKGIKDIAILPVEDPNIPWRGNEYIAIYPRIWETNDDGWAVFAPGKRDGGIDLARWLRN